MKLYKINGEKILVKSNRPYRFLLILSPLHFMLRYGHAPGMKSHVITCGTIKDYGKLFKRFKKLGKITLLDEDCGELDEYKTSLTCLLPSNVYEFRGGVRFLFNPSGHIENFDFLTEMGYKTVYKYSETCCIIK